MKTNWLLAAMLATTIGLAVPAMAQSYYANGNLIAPAPDPALATDGHLHWSGDVDNTTTIYIHERHVSMIVDSGKSPRNVYEELDGRLSHQPTVVTLSHWNGRGMVDIVQQPTPDNGFTAAVQVTDPQPGRGHYDFDLSW